MMRNILHQFVFRVRFTPSIMLWNECLQSLQNSFVIFYIYVFFGMKLSGAIFKSIFFKADWKTLILRKKKRFYPRSFRNQWFLLALYHWSRFSFSVITNANVADKSSSWFDHILSNKEDIFLTHYKTKAFRNCC